MNLRHHVLRTIRARFRKEAGVAAIVEDTLSVEDPISSTHWKSRPLRMEIYIPGAYVLHTSDLAVDTTIVYPYDLRPIATSIVTTGSIGTDVEREKNLHYGDYWQQHYIILFTVGDDIYGALGDEGHSVSDVLLPLLAPLMISLLRRNFAILLPTFHLACKRGRHYR